jgi:hypothetical protein
MGIGRTAVRAGLVSTTSLVTALCVPTLSLADGSAAVGERSGLTVTGRVIVAGEDDPVYALARADGSLVPVSGTLDEMVGDRVTARLQIPQPLDALPGSPLTADALRAWDRPLAASVISSTEVAATSAPVEHRVFVAKPTNVGGFTLTDAQLLGELATVSAFWVDEADGEITSFDLPSDPDDVAQFKTYETDTSASAVCSLSGSSFFTQVQEAADLFPGASFFGGGATDLLVVLTPDQGCDAGTVGIGSVGSSYTGGGATINRTEPAYVESVLAHELGHNFGLAHSNVGTQPYRNVYNVMAFALSGVNQLTAMSTAYRVGTGLDDPGEVETVAIPDVMAPTSVTRTLKPRADTTGLRALEVTVPGTGRTFYVEFRGGQGQDAGSAYALNASIGSYLFRPGVVVEEIVDVGAGVGVSLVTHTPGTRVASVAGETWVSPDGRVSVSVTSLAGTGADVTLAYEPGVISFTSGPSLSTTTPRVGEPVQVVYGDDGPAGSTRTVQWYAGGIPIGGATAASFAPTAAQQGTVLTATVTVSATGYTSASATTPGSSPVAPTLPPDPPPAPTPAPTPLLGAVPTIDGDTRVGEVLTGRIGTWTAGATLAYQWFADNAAISGATATTYMPGPAQQGSVLKLQVVGTLDGKTLTRTSAGTPKVALGTLVAGKPKIRGKAVAGKRLKARPGSWAPGTTFTYRWLANGKPVKRNGSGKVLKVTRALKGARLRVRVTASLPGYASRVVVSAKTAKVTV